MKKKGERNRRNALRGIGMEFRSMMTAVRLSRGASVSRMRKGMCAVENNIDMLAEVVRWMRR